LFRWLFVLTSFLIAKQQFGSRCWFYE